MAGQGSEAEAGTKEEEPDLGAKTETVVGAKSIIGTERGNPGEEQDQGAKKGKEHQKNLEVKIGGGGESQGVQGERKVKAEIKKKVKTKKQGVHTKKRTLRVKKGT